MKQFTMRRISALESATAPISGPRIIVLAPGGSSSAPRRYMDGLREWNARPNESQEVFEGRVFAEAEHFANSKGRVALVAATIFEERSGEN